MCDSTTETKTADTSNATELGLAPVQDSSCGCGSAKDTAVQAPDVAGSINFDLQGLTCGSCVRKVETLVAGLAGVESASVALVNGGTSTLSVAGDVSPETVTAAVIAAGYPAEVSA
ncbi:copper chaperone CopZ [Arthrobacter stackebrandtii]|uniref:Copper chaperone CopZ n=1 Tax=Arthrobacter stackebrandtii TaxID=272161 RepID=A0ABS4YVI8_9MICC|nr:heavy metal-associated domain-containing protein [Arthrobacter stackebrandtii]MBP2412620.1 copper chaperone CopZ [Arthrobacter stackebrandtii]PYG98786.1 hypothetical protein CVV67_18525 [Arthrobacter stackebrandtii]